MATITDKMTEYARSKVGGRYVFAASGPVDFDCSGLTKRIAQVLGLNFYHGATTQWLRGFEPGDGITRGYWAQSGTIDTLPRNAPAVFLFNQDKSSTHKLVMAHTGYYDGKTGNVIQAGGYGGKGVHENKLDIRRWSHWAIAKGTEQGGEIQVDGILRRGSTGDEVKAMQMALINLKYDLGRWGADGKFGEKTEAAVMKFQGLNGLTVDGAWGADERAALYIKPPTPSDVATITLTLPREAANALYDALKAVI